MDLIEQVKSWSSSYGPTAVAGVLGLLALFIAFKVVKFIFKVILVLVGLALIAGAVIWLFAGH
ncbi:MAG TPA: hypothetical protein VEC99_19270 [Clostridia bacterium]|nr:hypothetical protein [Clostridia bacterium]